MSAIVPKVMSFPLGGVDAQGRLAYAEDDQSVREVIRNILLTGPGERLMRSAFGAGLLEFIHQPNNETTRTLLANLVRKAIEQWETRVKVADVSVLPDPQSLTQIQIVIRYQMRHSPQPLQLSLGMDLSSL
jgi:phage baseplate assembly protein W